MAASGNFLIFIATLYLSCQVTLTLPLPNFILQGIQKDLFKSSREYPSRLSLLDRAESVTMKYCRPMVMNDLVIQQVDDCLHRASGLVTGIANKCDLRAYGMYSLNEQRMAKCASVDSASRKRIFVDCYIAESNRLASTGDTRAQLQMTQHNNLLMSLTYVSYEEWMTSELRRLLPCLESALASVPMPVADNSGVLLTGRYPVSQIAPPGSTIV